MHARSVHKFTGGLFFTTMLALGNFVVLNLFLAILLQNFDNTGALEAGGPGDADTAASTPRVASREIALRMRSVWRRGWFTRLAARISACWSPADDAAPASPATPKSPASSGDPRAQPRSPRADGATNAALTRQRQRLRARLRAAYRVSIAVETPTAERTPRAVGAELSEPAGRGDAATCSVRSQTYHASAGVPTPGLRPSRSTPREVRLHGRDPSVSSQPLALRLAAGIVGRTR